MRILVTGHKGYIGSVLTPMLVERGFDVVGLDAGLYDGCSFVPDATRVAEMARDIRDIDTDDLLGFDAIIHLAALSNDPLGNLSRDLTEQINFAATARLGALARDAGVRRFLFSSSCIMYGLSTLQTVDETAPLAPQTTYAESKVAAERALGALANRTFSPVFLRNGTVYGVSPRMRFDTVFNSLMGSGFTTRHVDVFSDGTPWRPVIHVEDVSRAFIALLDAPLEVVHNQAFNVGADTLNHQVSELAEAVRGAIAGCDVCYLGQPDADQRTYRASFARIARLVPEFQVRWDIHSAAARMRDEFDRVGLTHAMFRDPRFTRLAWIKRSRDEGRLDEQLRVRSLAQ
jgi:nucleoside-diphosphate-sugar epimerase